MLSLQGYDELLVRERIENKKLQEKIESLEAKEVRKVFCMKIMKISDRNQRLKNQKEKLKEYIMRTV